MQTQKSAKSLIDTHICCFVTKWPLWTVLLPYYGFAHDGFLLLNQLCKKTRSELKIKHKAFWFAMKQAMQEAEFSKTAHPTSLSLFKLNFQIGITFRLKVSFLHSNLWKIMASSSLKTKLIFEVNLLRRNIKDLLQKLTDITC